VDAGAGSLPLALSSFIGMAGLAGLSLVGLEALTAPPSAP
jgi:hypothetical protein